MSIDKALRSANRSFFIAGAIFVAGTLGINAYQTHRDNQPIRPDGLEVVLEDVLNTPFEYTLHVDDDNVNSTSIYKIYHIPVNSLYPNASDDEIVTVVARIQDVEPYALDASELSSSDNLSIMIMDSDGQCFLSLQDLGANGFDENDTLRECSESFPPGEVRVHSRDNITFHYDGDSTGVVRSDLGNFLYERTINGLARHIREN